MMVSDDGHDEPHDYQQARINLASNLFLKSQMDPGKKRGEYFLPTHSESKRGGQLLQDPAVKGHKLGCCP